MGDRLRPRLSFANVVSVLALFVALGGAAYAGSKINGKSIKAHSIGAKKLKPGVLTGLDKCPGDAPTNIKGLCVGRVNSPAVWESAAKACAAKGERLPSTSEALLVTDAQQLGFIWSDDWADVNSPGELRVVVHSDDSARISIDDPTATRFYVCVINATS